MSESARELEDAGDYDDAARKYAREGFDRFLVSHFGLDGECRIGIGMILQAISCDVRAGNSRRAEHLFAIIEPLLVELRYGTDDNVLRGLAFEWLGDGKLMLEEGDAVENYRSALLQFQDLTWEDTTWQEEPDFMQAYWAMESFSQYHGRELPPPVPSVEFQERVEAKIELADDFP